ncbi:MAG TPA: hypothetical protein VLI90_18225, partial [Tepidisphaeraceae bacterium]|nr:hypothetical protein [Tepidisphaeraceae bacterium]
MALRAPAQVGQGPRFEPAIWRYTLNRPAEGWQAPGFDDVDWRTGRGAFGTAGTPGITINSNWSTADIWLRRAFVLPTTALDVPATQLLVFHDEDVEIYFDGVLAARAAGFVRDYEPMEILPEARRLLKPGGSITVAVHCHQTIGGQGIDVGLTKVSSEWLAVRRRNAYRAFALNNTGNAAAGRRLFLDEQRVGCIRCHTIDGSASRAGPDLQTIGDKFVR